jgi:hypothetical protein
MGESNKSLLSDIISARENIKIKYNELKRGKYETDAFINDTISHGRVWSYTDRRAE